MIDRMGDGERERHTYRKNRGNEWKGWDKEKIKRSWKMGDSKRREEERRERREEMNQKGGTKRR